ncbi:MAG TPA: sugar ABC transporter substrate-binding protein [Ktedonobacterales bacterium]|nr:sugar ABC transporter substrate-binding protein [Ktedonobacterales bacterium]
MNLFKGPRLRVATTLLLGGVLATGMLAGCSGGSTTGATGPKGCMKVGVLLPETDTSPRWESKDHPLLDAAIKKALPGVTTDFYNAANNKDTQTNQAETALTKGDCILVVAPVDATASAAIVDKAKQQNVPVIAYDRLIQNDDLKFYVSFDNVEVGKLQGQYIADHYQKYVTNNGNNNLVMINGSQDDNNAILFHDGAHSVLDPLISSKALNLQLETYTPAWNNQTAQTEMEGALTKVSNKLAVAYVANDGMASTVIAALKAQGLAGKVLVTGQDATVVGFQNILQGYQAMTVYKAIGKEADATAALVAALSKGTDTSSLATTTIKLADGKTVPAELETPVAVDISNISSTVLADGFVTKADICQGVPAGAGGIC